MKDDPIIGREWSNYRVDSKIGEGGMGAVYRLVHKTIPGLYAALKVLNSQGATHASSRERFEQEAKVAAAIGKERVAGVIEQGEFLDGTPFIVMNLIEGQSLSALLEETGPLRVMTALRIAYHVTDTLVVAHSKQIVHRDIKPSNIMLTRTRDQEFAVTILDWGIAKARGEVQVAHTGTAAVAGTLGYMAPETLLPKPNIDGRADVFSLAVMLFKMLSGNLPYLPIASAGQVAEAIEFYRSHPISIGWHRPPTLDPVPRWLERIILRALVLDHTDRPTMDKFRQDLAEAMARLQKNPENRPAADEETEQGQPAPVAIAQTHQSEASRTHGDDATKRRSPSLEEQGTRNIANEQATSVLPRATHRRLFVVGAVLVLLLVAIGLSFGVKRLPQSDAVVDMRSPSDLSVARPNDLASAQLPDLAEKSSRPIPTSVPKATPRPAPPKFQNKRCKRNAAGALICP
jgi:serine/threonine protein kinase